MCLLCDIINAKGVELTPINRQGIKVGDTKLCKYQKLSEDCQQGNKCWFGEIDTMVYHQIL